MNFVSLIPLYECITFLFYSVADNLSKMFSNVIFAFSICLHKNTHLSMDMCSPITKFTEEGHSEYLFSYGE